MVENIQIKGEVDRRNPNLCRFTSDRTLYVETKMVNRRMEAKGLLQSNRNRPEGAAMREIGCFTFAFRKKGGQDAKEMMIRRR
jgi:hypothetical protein